MKSVGQFALPANMTLGNYLGKGAYGYVYSAERRVSTETNETEQVAIKCIKNYCKHPTYPFILLKRIAREVEILRAFQNNYEFVHMEDLYLSEDKCDLYIVMQRVSCPQHQVGNDLAHILNFHRVPGKAGLDEGLVRDMVLQILLGLKRMKECGVLHRDLKPGNILVDEIRNPDGTSQFNCHIADFGLGRAFDSEDPTMVDNMTTNVVTMPYRPPELLLKCRTVDHQVDVWSVGCIMFEMLTGSMLARRLLNLSSRFRVGPPMALKDDQAFLTLIIMLLCGTPNFAAWRDRASSTMREFLEENKSTFENPKVVPMGELLQKPTSPEAVQVLEAMLKFDPAERATPEELLEYKWFTDNEHCKAEIDNAENYPNPEAMAAVDKMTFEQLVEQVQERVTLEPSHSVDIDLSKHK